MHLSPRDIDKLLLHNAGFLAQKRLARGLRLNYPESVALIASQTLEFIREGKSVATLMDLGRKFLGTNQTLPGIPSMILEVQVEGTFPDGTKLVTVHHPIVLQDGDLSLALHGSFLRIPPLSAFTAPLPGASSRQGDASSSQSSVLSPQHSPGEPLIQPGDLTLNAGRPTITLAVTNTGDRPIQVGSHYHFIETNPALSFDRAKSYGHRLDIPAGAAVRFEPGDTKTITLVPIAGHQIIAGGNNLAPGKLTDANRAAAMQNIKTQNFAHHPETPHP